MEKIKELREKTGAGMIDCKKALEEAGGDMEKAIEILRKKGIAKAAKRSDREASEGIVKVWNSDDSKEGVIMEANAETDFVVRSDKFQTFVEQSFAALKSNKPASMDEFMAISIDGISIKDSLESLSGVIGEKLDIKRFDIVNTAGTVVTYSHMGGRIGVLVELDTPDQSDLAREIAMQVAAANPKYLSPENVPADEIEKEKDVYRELLVKEGKPADMIEKIMVGKVNKYYEEVCLVKQEFIKDDKKKVSDVLGSVKVVKFVRFSL